MMAWPEYGRPERSSKPFTSISKEMIFHYMFGCCSLDGRLHLNFRSIGVNIFVCLIVLLSGLVVGLGPYLSLVKTFYSGVTGWSRLRFPSWRDEKLHWRDLAQGLGGALAEHDGWAPPMCRQFCTIQMFADEMKFCPCVGYVWPKNYMTGWYWNTLQSSHGVASTSFSRLVGVKNGTRVA